jgi:hypothetical protein
VIFLRSSVKSVWEKAINEMTYALADSDKYPQVGL